MKEINAIKAKEIAYKNKCKYVYAEIEKYCDKGLSSITVSNDLINSRLIAELEGKGYKLEHTGPGWTYARISWEEDDES